MFRRFLVTPFRRSFVLLLVVCLGCTAQSVSPDLAQKIERQVRAYYKVPAELKVLVGPASPSSDFPNYDSIVVTIDNGERKQDLNFLVSKDHSSLIRMNKFDLSKDPYADTMSKIDTTGRPTRGAKASKVVVVNFDDFQCPFCARMHQEIPKVGFWGCNPSQPCSTPSNTQTYLTCPTSPPLFEDLKPHITHSNPM